MQSVLIIYLIFLCSSFPSPLFNLALEPSPLKEIDPTLLQWEQEILYTITGREFFLLSLMFVSLQMFSDFFGKFITAYSREKNIQMKVYNLYSFLLLDAKWLD